MQQDFSHEYIIDPTRIASRLLHINVHKSIGRDGLPSWLLQDLAPLLSQPLAALFNALLREGNLPPIWKSVEVVPVPKVHAPTSIPSGLYHSSQPLPKHLSQSQESGFFPSLSRISITASLAFASRGQPRMLSLPSSTLGWLHLIHMAQFAVFLWIFKKPLIW